MPHETDEETYANEVSDFIDPDTLTPDNHRDFEEHCRRGRAAGLTPKQCAEEWGAKPLN